MGEKNCSKKFIAELYQRITDAPIKAAEGSRFIAVDLKGSSREFSDKATLFLENNPEIFRVLVRGPQIYVELLNGHSVVDACKEDSLPETGRSH